MGGIRYWPRIGNSSLHPFVQVLAGGAHSSGSLVEGPDSNATNAGAALTSNAGGGLDLGLTTLLSLRLVEADYFVATYNNLVNDHQDNLRIGVGVVLHF
jgi:hypothetical protein